MGHAEPSLAAILCGSFIVSTELQAPWGPGRYLMDASFPHITEPSDFHVACAQHPVECVKYFLASLLCTDSDFQEFFEKYDHPQTLSFADVVCSKDLRKANLALKCRLEPRYR